MGLYFSVWSSPICSYNTAFPNSLSTLPIQVEQIDVGGKKPHTTKHNNLEIKSPLE